VLVGASGDDRAGACCLWLDQGRDRCAGEGFCFRSRPFRRARQIAPSIAETALTGPFKQRPDIYNLYAVHTVFDRWSRADEVATAVAYLASDAASYVSGSTLFVDGGWTAVDGPADRAHAAAQITGSRRGRAPHGHRRW
jgi:hypothetical protein